MPRDAVTAVLVVHLLSELKQTLSLQLPLFHIRGLVDLHQFVYYFQNVSLIVYVLENVSESNQYIIPMRRATASKALPL